jgi:multiple sugar transport system permease protein
MGRIPVGRWLVWLFLAVFAGLTLFPIYWAINTSFKTPVEVYAQPPTFVPRDATAAAYEWVAGGGKGLQAFRDSAIVSLSATVLAVTIGTIAGYGFSRFGPLVGGERMAFWLLSTRMTPPIVAALPLFFLFQGIGLVDTHQGLILAYLGFNVPLATWMMRSFFNDVPRSYEEAAYLDGYSLFRTFRRVTLPLVMPGVVATAILVWIFSWNEFLMALVLSGREVTPFPPLLPTLASGYQIQWNNIMALSLIAIIPPVLIIVLFRQHLVRGLSLGAVANR